LVSNLQRYARLHAWAVALRGESLVWMLLLGHAASLAALLFTLWRCQRLRRLVDVCAGADTITAGHTSLSLGQYLIKRLNIRVSHGLSRQEAATLTTHLASLSTKGRVASRTNDRRLAAGTKPHALERASPPSALDEFPEEQGLTANGPHSPARRTVP
jgi:hypothetical protein